MKQAELIKKIKAEAATRSQYRRYSELVSSRAKKENACCYGHYACALVEGGPCSNECYAKSIEGILK